MISYNNQANTGSQFDRSVCQALHVRLGDQEPSSQVRDSLLRAAAHVHQPVERQSALKKSWRLTRRWLTRLVSHPDSPTRPTPHTRMAAEMMNIHARRIHVAF